MKLSQIISKEVLSLYDAKKIATVLKPEFSEDYLKIKSFIVFDNDENELELSVQDIYSVADYVSIKNMTKLKPSIAQSKDIIGKEVIDTDGKSYGKIVDIELDENYIISKILTDKTAVENYTVLYAGDEFIINGKEMLNSSKLKPRTNVFKTFENQNISVKIQSVKTEKQPLKINGNTNILLGRKLTIDIFGKNNEIIAKKNQIINEKIINNAKLHNKVNYLMYNSTI